jgi:hypothetical protein
MRRVHCGGGGSRWWGQPDRPESGEGEGGRCDGFRTAVPITLSLGLLAVDQTQPKLPISVPAFSGKKYVSLGQPLLSSCRADCTRGDTDLADSNGFASTLQLNNGRV